MVVYLIDGSAICYRAFYSYATRDLHNSKGFPTNVPYGFLLCLRKIMKDFNPDALAITFDVKGPTFRHEKYEEYKANRKPMPDDMSVQLPVLRELIEAFQIPIVEKEGYEADDLLGTMAKKYAEDGHEVMIVTSDKDAMQLVNKKIRIMDPGKDYAIYGKKEVIAKMGVPPDRVIDLLALMGDSSDNIPGVPGIGPKTALQLLKDFKDLETVLESASKIKGASKQKAIEENKDKALMSRELATIDQNVPLNGIDLKSFKVSEPNFDALLKVYKELEFRSFLKELGQNGSAPKKDSKYTLVTTDKEWQTLLAKLNKVKSFAFDFETTSIDAIIAEPVGLSFSFKDHESFFVLFDYHTSGKSKLAAKKVLQQLKPLFENSKVEKFGQNIKYEMMVLKQYGIDLEGVAFDTMVASYILNPSKSNHNLGSVALEYLNENLIPIQNLIGTGKSQITMAEADLDLLSRYGCQDSDVVWRLVGVLDKALDKVGMKDLLDKIELPLIHVLCEMECNGICLDLNFLKKLSKEMAAKIEKLKKSIFKEAGEEFNINSTKQLSEILFVKLKLPVIRRTKTGFSTDMDVLEQLSNTHELPALIHRYRELSKLKSTYIEPMPELLNPKTKRIHSSFNQTVTATGRLSSSDPNLQNIPIRTEEGRKIRHGFVSDKGMKLFSADYSQIELRVLAHLSKDKHLQKAFQDGEDVHTYTASLIFDVNSKDVTSRMRDEAKTVNFGVLYGMSAFGLSKSLKISQEAAKDFIDSYFERYPKIKSFLDDTIAMAKKKGYVETLFKRRRYIPDINSNQMRVRQFAERTAINAPVQGTASDLIKIAMISIHKKLPKLMIKAKMLLQVHDELVFEVEDNQIHSIAKLVKDEMENVIQLAVPIEVKMKTGSNWMEMSPLASDAV